MRETHKKNVFFPTLNKSFLLKCIYPGYIYHGYIYQDFSAQKQSSCFTLINKPSMISITQNNPQPQS